MGAEKRVALVTGGAQGIGRATVLALAREGADVAVADLDVERARLTAGEARALGVRAAVLQVNVSNWPSVEQMFRSSMGELGRVDILVNCAGTIGSAKGLDVSEREWDRIVDVNLKGTFLCCKVAVPSMVERGWGRVVNIASLAAFSGSITGDLPYAASKAGVVAFTKTLAKEVAPKGVNVNAIAPGPIDTEFQTRAGGMTREELRSRSAARVPVGRIGTPEDIAGVVVFLTSEAAGFVTGATIDVNGGALMR